MKRIVYYNTLEDDFCVANKDFKLPQDYKWIKNDPFSKLKAGLTYFLAIVFSFFYCRIFLRVRYVGAKKLKKQKGGFFIFQNHTQPVGDVFIPAICCLPKRIYTVVSSQNFALKGINRVLRSLGALPIGDNLSQMKEFTKAVETRYLEGHPIAIFPEAHVWEYCGFIRPFSSAPFKYPAKLDAAVFSATVTYQKAGLRKRPKAVVYIDGPFLPSGETTAEKTESLFAAVKEAMCERAKQTNVEFVKYIKK